MKLYTFDKLNKIKKIRNTGFVYCVDYHNGKIKIGSTKSPYDRYKSLSSNASRYGNYPLGDMWVSKRCTNYKDIEKQLHKIFADKRIPNTELFELDFDMFGDNEKELNLKYENKRIKSESKYTHYDDKLLTCFLIALINSPEDSAKVHRETERLYKEL